MKLSPAKRNELESHAWRVYTTSEPLQAGITEYLNQVQESLMNGLIFYRGGQLPVYIIPFSVAEQLADNRSRWQGHTLAIFHRARGESVWRKWQEEKKTPHQKVATAKRGGHLRRATQI